MERSKKLNLGINILRMWMAFEVILLHRMSWKGYDGLFFNFLKRCELFSVPVFMIIAFYFSTKAIEEQDPAKIRNRFIRLIIPQVGWAIICWIAYVLMDIVFMHQLSHNFMDLIIAIISGCRETVNPSTWFQCVLIILTAFYCFVFHVFDKKKAWIIVYVSFIVSLLIQFNGSYYDFFENTPYEVTNTIGRIFEVMPFTCIGMFLKHIEVYKLFENIRIPAIALCGLLFIVGFYIPFPQFKGFFAGPYTVYMSTLLFICFLLFPLENVKEKARNVIITVTRFTLGIYCAHRLVYGIMDVVYELIKIEPKNFSKCIITYLACYLMSLIMSMIPVGFIKKMVD